MPFKWTIRVTNPSTYERSDYVEVDLESLGVDHRLDEKSLRLLRCWPGGHAEEAPFQIDYPFGPDVAYRILTLFCPSTPPGDADYKEPSAEFSLEEGTHRDFAEINKELLKIEHFAVPGIGEQFWDRTKRIIGVKLCNGSAPSQQQEVQYDGLQVYFVTVPRSPSEKPPLPLVSKT